MGSADEVGDLQVIQNGCVKSLGVDGLSCE